MKSLVDEQSLICKTIEWPHPTQQTWMVIAEPENESKLLDLRDVTRLLSLENELRSQRERLARLEGHPYVRFGKRLNRLIQRLRAKRP